MRHAEKLVYVVASSLRKLAVWATGLPSPLGARECTRHETRRSFPRTLSTRPRRGPGCGPRKLAIELKRLYQFLIGHLPILESLSGRIGHRHCVGRRGLEHHTTNC